MENNKELSTKKIINNYLKNNFNLKNNLYRLMWFLISAVVVLVPVFIMRDWALNSTSQTYGNPNDFISIFITTNTGAGFSLLKDSTWAVYLLQSLASLIMLTLVIFVNKWYYVLLLSLAFFGGLGNIIDRIIPDYFVNASLLFDNPYENTVVDYFKFSFNFGIFNVADVFVCTGTIGSAILLFVFVFITAIKEVKKDRQLKKEKENEKNKSK